jgi:hypothetical protein
MEPAVIDQTIVDARQRMRDAHDLSCFYSRRAVQLTRWKRWLDFVSLGVVPGIALAVTDKPYVREIGFIVAGLCSTAAYVWSALGFAFLWERQLDVAQRASTQARLISRQLRALLAEVDVRLNALDGNPGEIVLLINNIIEQYEELYNEINTARVDSKPSMSLPAQQAARFEVETMWSICGVEWGRTQHRFQPLEGKNFLQRLCVWYTSLRYETMPRATARPLTELRLQEAAQALARERENCPRVADGIADERPASEENEPRIDAQWVVKWQAIGANHAVVAKDVVFAQLGG